MSHLAIHGGKPVRTTPLRPDFPGASLFGEEEKQAVLDVLERCSPFRYYGPDPCYKVRAFEEAFAVYMTVPHALAVSSGTAALIVALEALGVSPGDEVLVPANTFLASPGAVRRSGATPVYVDVDDTFNLAPSDLPRKLTSKTVAVMPVHFEGSACDMEPILEFAQRHGLAVLEDAAQACGARYRGQPVGSFGDIGAFSFQINKMITAGEGGAVVTRHAELYERAVRVHDQGNLREADGSMGFDTSRNVLVGENYRMSELSGAVLGEQLKKLDALIARMRAVAQEVREEIQDLPGLALRRHADPAGEVGRRIFMILDNEDLARNVERAVRAENVPVGRLYGGRPVYEHPQVGVRDPGCPNADSLLRRTVTLSVNPTWSARDIRDIVAAVRKVLTYFQAS
jgi:8-amino-3,8-dideoxy-alpha-D-manno-octulosonate transaminase